MRKKLYWPVLLLTLMLWSLMYPECAISGARKEQSGMEKCIAKIMITRDQNPFREWDNKNSNVARKDSTIRAVDLDVETYDTVGSLSRYAVRDVMLMGIEKKTREPAVSTQYFSPLARLDATRLDPGQSKKLGRLLNVSASPLALREMVLFFLESQIITTYWHVESVICLTSEYDSADVYKASFRGIHKYYTNTYNEEKLDFAITIHKKTGDITLLGGP